MSFPEHVFWFSSDPWLVDTDDDNATDAEDFTPREYNEFVSYIFYPMNGEDFLKEEADTRYRWISEFNNKTVQRFATTDIDDFEEQWNQMGIKGVNIVYKKFDN